MFVVLFSAIEYSIKKEVVFIRENLLPELLSTLQQSPTKLYRYLHLLYPLTWRHGAGPGLLLIGPHYEVKSSEGSCAGANEQGRLAVLGSAIRKMTEWKMSVVLAE